MDGPHVGRWSAPGTGSPHAAAPAAPGPGYAAWAAADLDAFVKQLTNPQAAKVSNQLDSYTIESLNVIPFFTF